MGWEDGLFSISFQIQLQVLDFSSTSKISVFCFTVMKNECFCGFCCILILALILEPQCRMNFVITGAKVKCIPPTTTTHVVQIVFKRMVWLINIYSQTHHSKKFVTQAKYM